MDRTQAVPWWTPEQCAEYLATTTDYLKKLRHQKKGPPYFKEGRRILYHPVQVARWMRGKQHGYEPQITVPRAMPRTVPGPTLQVRRG